MGQKLRTRSRRVPKVIQMTLDVPVKKTYRLLQRTRAKPSFGPSSWVLEKCQHGCYGLVGRETYPFCMIVWVVGIYRNFLNPLGDNNEQENYRTTAPEFCGVSKGLKYLVLLTPGFDDVVARRPASTENENVLICFQ